MKIKRNRQIKRQTERQRQAGRERQIHIDKHKDRLGLTDRWTERDTQSNRDRWRY